MRTEKRNRIIIAWLLIAFFTMPLVTKTIHIHEVEQDHASCSHSKDCQKTPHDCNSCAICQFAFSSFTEANLITPDLKSVDFSIQEYVLYQEKGHSTTTHICYLRAPPQFA